jgi:hypothetical protein
MECSDSGPRSLSPNPRAASPASIGSSEENTEFARSHSSGEGNYRIRPFSNSYRASLVPLPKLKSKAPVPLIFDSSSYTGKQRLKVHDLTPTYIKKEARINLFAEIEKIPRKHASTTFHSRAGSQLKEELS